MTKFELKDDYRTASHEAVGILGLSQEEISEASGYYELFAKLTPAKRQFALAAVEVYRMFAYKNVKQTIRSSQDIYDYMKSLLLDVGNEECWVILLNSACSVIKRVRLSVGGIDSALVDVRVVLKEALLASASSIALVHNHPSGNRRPSRADDSVTETLRKSAQVMDIRLLDHLIFTEDGFYSYADEGRL